MRRRAWAGSGDGSRKFRMKNIYSVLLLALGSVMIMGKTVQAKRLPPKDVPPVIHEGIRYTARYAGLVEAFNDKTGEKLWDVKVYGTPINPELEEDVQFVYIRSLQLFGTQLLVSDERQGHFVVDIRSRQVSKLEVLECKSPAAPNASFHRRNGSTSTVLSMLAEWWFGASWDFVQFSGGIAVYAPLRDADGRVYMLTRFDISRNSALVIKRVAASVAGKDIFIAVKTGLCGKGDNEVRSGGVWLGRLAAGDYDVYYFGGDRQKHLLSKVSVP